MNIYYYRATNLPVIDTYRSLLLGRYELPVLAQERLNGEQKFRLFSRFGYPLTAIYYNLSREAAIESGALIRGDFNHRAWASALSLGFSSDAAMIFGVYKGPHGEGEYVGVPMKAWLRAHPEIISELTAKKELWSRIDDQQCREFLVEDALVKGGLLALCIEEIKQEEMAKAQESKTTEPAIAAPSPAAAPAFAPAASAAMPAARAEVTASAQPVGRAAAPKLSAA